MQEIDVSASEVQRHFAEHLDRALSGEGFVITRHGRAVAQLGPVEARSKESGGDE
jgi:prevent-host-death family protein